MTRRGRGVRRLALALLAVASSAASAPAMTILPVDLPTLTAQAARIFVGRVETGVLDVADHPDDRGPRARRAPAFVQALADRALVRKEALRPGLVHDDRAVANIIIGPGIPPPALHKKGHFHPESAEFWFILLNKIRYNIEGMPVFEASQGDIVYVPKMRYHLASFGGDGPSCRLAMNGYVDLSHSFDADEAK